MPRAKLSETERKASRKASRRKYNSSDKGKAKTAEYNRRWNADNREKRNALNRDWYANNAQSVLDQKRLAAYGITAEQYTDMLVQQGNMCAICKTKTPGGKGTWHIDHCHSTGWVRGILCHHCNLGLGNFKDNPASLAAAIQYIQDIDDARTTYGSIPRVDEQDRPNS